MSRAKRLARQQAEEEVARRRNSAAHRGLRRRAARGQGALSVGVPTASMPHDQEMPSTGVDDTPPDNTAADDTAVFGAVADTAAMPPVQTTTPAPVAPSPAPPTSAPPERVSVTPAPAPPAPGPSAVEAPTPVDLAEGAPAPAEDVAAPPAPITTPSGTEQPPPAHSAPVASTGEQPHEDSAPETHAKRRKGWIVPFVIVGIAVLYVGAQALLSNTVPGSTETLGTDIGGMSAVQAEGRVDERARQLGSEDIQMRAAEQTFALPAVDAGLSIDAEATVAHATGFTLAPDRLWAHIVGAGVLEPVVTVDEEALAEALESAATQLDGPAQDASVTVSDEAVAVVPGRSAVTVDQPASAPIVAAQWPQSQSIELAAQTEQPTITGEDAEVFARELESQTFAGAVTLVGEDAEAVIEPATIASHSTVVSSAAGLALEVEGEPFTAAILEANPGLTTEGENASVSFDDDHQIVIDEGTPGVTIDADRVGSAAIAAAQRPDRTGELPYTAADPEVSADDLGLADYQEQVVSFDSPLTAERIRTQNLRAAAGDVQGTILHPGDTFDLVETLSPITEEEGYGPAHVIVNGILTTGMGGGLSQMATNTYNAAYFAGYELIDHRPHSVWFPRYPAGRESTMYTGSINVVFKNNTPYSAVLNSYIEGGRLYVDLWSTKHFEVETIASPRSNVQQPGVKEVTADNCEAKGPGQPGFTITNTRTVLLDGQEVDSNSDTWTYRPDDAIKCVSPDDKDDGDDD